MLNKDLFVLKSASSTMYECLHQIMKPSIHLLVQISFLHMQEKPKFMDKQTTTVKRSYKVLATYEL